MKYALITLLFSIPLMMFAQDKSVMPDSTSVEDFMKMLQQAHEIKDGRDRNPVSVYEWHGKGKWVKDEDVDYLLRLIRSEEKCPCIASPFSSTLPPVGEHATIGGIAMDLTDYYRTGSKFPGTTTVKHGKFESNVWYRCPKTDMERIKEVEAWATGKYQR